MVVLETCSFRVVESGLGSMDWEIDGALILPHVLEIPGRFPVYELKL